MILKDVCNHMTNIEQAIALHKMLSGKLYAAEKSGEILDLTDNRELITYILLAKEIALVLSDFKCERCQFPDKITIHHMIEARNECYCKSKLKYILQRNYFANLICLCNTCHYEVHHGLDKENNKAVNDIMITSLKKKYGVK